MKLIVGLGNPGKEYADARHNVGFTVVEKLAKQEGVEFRLEKKLDSEIAKTRVANKPVILAKPQTFVNESGRAVRKLVISFKIGKENLIVIHDDLDIEFGNFKLSFGKDSAGHRGVQSIIDRLKTNKFWRLRIGTANHKLIAARRQRNSKAKKAAVGDFVLSRFAPAEQAKLGRIIKKALERLEAAL